MNRSRTRFTRKLYLAALVLLGVLLVLAGTFYESAHRYQAHLERSKLAHNVFESYLTVSNHTFRKLNAMGEIVASGRVDNVDRRFANAQALRQALDEVRQAIEAEVDFVEDAKEEEDEEKELAHFAKIATLAEKIIEVSIRIRDAVATGSPAVAARELSRLRGGTTIDSFNRLIDIALAEELREVAQMDEATRRLRDYVAAVLPLIIGGALVAGVWGTVAFSRSITRSVNELRTAASAFASGDFAYRIPTRGELEFAELGNAFNDMARELAEKKTLETVVEERTRELEASNSRLEELDQSRRRLLADISHELRSPLTVIRGESEMALRGAEKTSAEYREALNRVLVQADHTSRLVDDLLFMVRAEEGHLRVAMRSVPVVSLLKTVGDDFKMATAEKQLTVTQSYADEQVVVLGDAGRLHQVFTILLNNAVRYSRVKGKIDVSLIRVGDFIQVEISDNGIGLTDEEARQAFSRFYRGDNAQQYAEGTGLGLPVAKAIVEAHNGEIELTGERDKGAKAVVRLPVEEKIRAVA